MPFCRVCKDAGKPSSLYTSHFVKDAPGGTVVCPTLLAQKCNYCHAKGHTPKYCPILLRKANQRHGRFERRAQLTTPSYEDWYGEWENKGRLLHQQTQEEFVSSWAGRSTAYTAQEEELATREMALEAVFIDGMHAFDDFCTKSMHKETPHKMPTLEDCTWG